MELTVRKFDPQNKASRIEQESICDFLHTHLDQFGDPKADIMKAIDYSLQNVPSPGGFVLSGVIDDEIVGAVVVNSTGMQGYIPENILVYIAINRNLRGKGLGKILMNNAIEAATGNIALHVEADNPAKYLYEKLGFENKYLEMRLIKNK